MSFDSGITSIVGPNGCGKSNIVDALRWVLGEQRPSLLRSSAMSNVIFNGTAKKKALGMAEVSLTFVNDKGILPIEYSEVTITRRLFRSGDSEYLINNTPCRLKDIMDLFMDTGMGSDAYSVIELKMVEEILNDKNNDRRRLFEEAAGVTRYKDQRKKTLRKLDETRKDLQRVDDLLIELRKKARSLEIQAEKAEKAKKYKDELEQLDKALTLHDVAKIEEELGPLQDRIRNAEKEKVEITTKAEQLEVENENARAQLLQKERQQGDAQRQASQLHNAVLEAETNIRITKEKIENEKKVITEYTRDIDQAEVDLKELMDLLGSSRSKLEGFDKELDKSEKILDESKKKYGQVQQQYNKERHELYELEVEFSAATNELNKLQTQQIKIESRLENTEGDLERINEEIIGLNDEIDSLNKERSSAETQLGKLVNERDEQETELEQAREKKEGFAAKQNEIKDELRTLHSRHSSLLNEIRLLNDVANSNEAYPGSVKYLMENHRFDFKEMFTVAEVFDTDEKHAIALESVLGATLNNVILPTLDEAKQAANKLKENRKGKATFIPLDKLSAKYDVIKGSLFDQVKCKPQYSALKQLLLGRVLVFNTVEEAYKGLKGTNAVGVTYDGEVITKSGFYKSGSKSKNTGMRVGLKDKIERLEKEKATTLKEIDKLGEYLTQITEKYTNIDLGQLSNLLKQKEQELRQLEQQQHSLGSKVQIYQKNITELVNRKDSLKSNEGTAQEELDVIKPKQKELEKKKAKLDTRQTEKKELLASLEEERSIAQSRFNDAQLKHQDLKNKVENHERDVRRAENGIESVQARIENRTKLTGQAKKNITEFRNYVESVEIELSKNKELKLEADQSLKKAEEAAAIQRGSINEIEKNLREIRSQKEVNLELVHHLSMAKEKMEMQIQGLSDHIWETYGILMKQVEKVDMPSDKTPDEVKQRIGWLRQKLNSFGEVNQLAIEEYKEEKERLDFYEEQIADLDKAEAQLLETIDEINTTATDRFNKTFGEIQTNFRKVFKTLFNEDDYCDLLIEEDVEDPLEARIEIKAQPKGKRPSGINQLSGGEKTLTAIALLFAIYLVKPSPFCVLDEVDAPLDDANIERFAKMIKNFSEETQFIIITHNKKTMSKAEMMYGVTMPETGVSRLVGVRMDDIGDAA
ncbi:MAG: chromosome segregation protein SMC [Balneolales bacterium]|nr:chromosome segregation protein SMC [Balneolales bacterium]